MKRNEIRLLHLVKSLQIGGVEKSTILYSNELVKKIDFVGIFGYKGDFDNSGLLSKNIKRFIPKYRPQNKAFFFKTLYFLIEVIQKNSITHVHYHQRIFIPYIKLIKILYPSVKIIYTHHSIYKDKINYFITADSVVALNDSTKKDLSFPLQKKTRIIPHGIYLNQNYPQKKFPPKNIGYVGRLVKGKGLFTLINAFSSIASKIPDIKLFLIGDGELKNSILEIIGEKNLTDKVILTTPMINEEDIYNKIDILVLPSYELEGFGLVLLEAMIRKIPVVVSNLPTLKNLITDGFNGLIFDNDLEAKLISILTNPTLYSTLGENGFNTVKEKYEIKNIIKQYLDLYKAV